MDRNFTPQERRPDCWVTHYRPPTNKPKAWMAAMTVPCLERSELMRIEDDVAKSFIGQPNVRLRIYLKPGAK